MAESFTPALLPSAKTERYAALAEEIAAVLEGESEPVARMASVAAMLAQSFPDFLWTGFYRVDPARRDELVVGPYQGTLGCLRVAIGKGVCGTAAARRETVIVADVARFAGHIACDARSRSEIVVPVLDPGGVLVAVLDVDSALPNTFDAEDAAGLEAIAAQVCLSQALEARAPAT